MPVKAAALVAEIHPGTTSGTMKIGARVVGITTPVESIFVVDNFDPGGTSVLFESNLEEAIKAFMTTEFGYTWGPSDSVRLIGALF